jgi:hypothetical protein
MKRVLFIFLALLALAGCSLQTEDPFIPSVLPTSAPKTGPPPAAALSSASEDIFQVDTWVNRPEPDQDERVIVYGSLIYRGVRLGGIMMRATWPQEGRQAGKHECLSLVTYGRGVCTLEAADFPAAVSVPITVTFTYQGQTYTGRTSFTPR